MKVGNRHLFSYLWLFTSSRSWPELREPSSSLLKRCTLDWKLKNIKKYTLSQMKNISYSRLAAEA